MLLRFWGESGVLLRFWGGGRSGVLLRLWGGLVGPVSAAWGDPEIWGGVGPREAVRAVCEPPPDYHETRRTWWVWMVMGMGLGVWGLGVGCVSVCGGWAGDRGVGRMGWFTLALARGLVLRF